jgi:flagellar assembly protein FliH
VERHPFDGLGRVTGRDLEAMSVYTWLPPLIDKTGHLVQALPRDEAARRGVAAGPKSQAERVDAGFQEGLLKGRIEGLAEGRKEGLEQGLKEGVEKGTQQGLQRAQKDVDAKLAAMDELMCHLTHAINEQDYVLEQALLNLVSSISRAVVGRELEINSSHILQIVREALAALPPSRDNVRIFVNPADVTLLDAARERNGDSWRVLPDDAVSRGGCRVETEQSLVDFTLERRFSAMIEQVLAKQLSRAETQEEFEPAPEPLVRPLATQSSSSTDVENAEELALTTAVIEAEAEPGLLEQVEYLRTGVMPASAGGLRTGT